MTGNFVAHSRRGGYAIAGMVYVSLFIAACAVMEGILTGVVGMVISLAVAAVLIWRVARWRVSVHEGVVSYHRFGGDRKFTDVETVSVVSSTLGAASFPIAAVTIETKNGGETELGVLGGIPFLKIGVWQARSSAAWLAGRLGMEQVDESTWRLPPREIL